MSALADKQAKFMEMFGQLLHHVSTMPDTRVRMSWAYRDAKANKRIGGHPRSTHLHRLAVDLVLDKRVRGKWVYQEATKEYTALGEFWEKLGGDWGGRFNDGGHFSLEHQGVR